jgi:predicted SAM-dependent methyltransferase
MQSGAALAVKVEPRRVLHAGCGRREIDRDIFPDWAETRLDIDPECYPDMVGSMANLDLIGDGEFDAVYTSHALEHLNTHDAAQALREFHRILKPGGFALVIVPDLEGMIYGHNVRSSPWMQHRCGYIKSTLERAFVAAGFVRHVVNRASGHNLIGAGSK